MESWHDVATIIAEHGQRPHFNGVDFSHWEYQAANQQIHWLKDCDGRDFPAVALLQLAGLLRWVFQSLQNHSIGNGIFVLTTGLGKLPVSAMIISNYFFLVSVILLKT